MTKLTYAQQLAHPLWQRRRLEMLSATGWICTTCAAADKQLHVHHRAYFKGRMAWEYADHELVVLCNTCHATEHEAKELLDELLLSVPHTNAPIQTALALLLGYFIPTTDTGFAEHLRISSRANSNDPSNSTGMAGFVAASLDGLSAKRHCEVIEFIDALRAQDGLDER